MPPKVRAKAAAQAKAGPKAKAAPPRRRAPPARAELVLRANACLSARRKAIRDVNALLNDLGLESLHLQPKDIDRAQFARALRVLNRRCQDPHKTRLRAAVDRWVQNRGHLPDGVHLRADGGGVEAAADDVETPSVIPHHQVLVSSFALKSKAFMVTYNSDAFTLDTWPAFKAHMDAFHRHHGSKACAACLEESMHAARAAASAEAGKKFHAHGYFLWTDGIGYRADSLDELRFEGVRPRVDKCSVGSASRAPRLAALHGLWYVSVMKAGTRASYTNFHPWLDYKPAKDWLVGLWDAHKLDHEAYISLSANFRSGHTSRRQEALAVMREEEEAKVRRHALAEAAAAQRAKPLTEPHASPVIETFVQSFSGSAWRRPLLAIVGASNYGKTALARRVLGRIAERLQLPSYLEITVEEDAHIDLAPFRIDTHAGILLDGVADVLLLKPHRETLQGQPKVCWGGKSSTMMYAYAFTLAHRAVVVTFDLSARNLHLLRSDHWLSDPRNVALLWLQAPAYGPELPPPPAPAAQMEAWSVRDVVSFFESKDARALGQKLEASSVTGADLMRLSVRSLQRSLSFNAFAAHKVCNLRDTFLRSDAAPRH